MSDIGVSSDCHGALHLRKYGRIRSGEVGLEGLEARGSEEGGDNDSTGAAVEAASVLGRPPELLRGPDEWSRGDGSDDDGEPEPLAPGYGRLTVAPSRSR